MLDYLLDVDEREAIVILKKSELLMGLSQTLHRTN